eukprot:IDg10247t1
MGEQRASKKPRMERAVLENWRMEAAWLQKRPMVENFEIGEKRAKFETGTILRRLKIAPPPLRLHDEVSIFGECRDSSSGRACAFARRRAGRAAARRLSQAGSVLKAHSVTACISDSTAHLRYRLPKFRVHGAAQCATFLAPRTTAIHRCGLACAASSWRRTCSPRDVGL